MVIDSSWTEADHAWKLPTPEDFSSALPTGGVGDAAELEFHLPWSRAAPRTTTAERQVRHRKRGPAASPRIGRAASPCLDRFYLQRWEVVVTQTEKVES